MTEENAVIKFQYYLSPLMAGLLLKEFPAEFIDEIAADGSFDKVRDQQAITNFLQGLEEHRLDLHCRDKEYSFFDAVLAYLEALLDPTPDEQLGSGIETTASAATYTWVRLPAEGRASLTREAAQLHPIIVALERARLSARNT